MSATLESDLLTNYFRCPVISVAGRAFPVTVHYLDEASLNSDEISHVS
jgi:HrpA-like RNA helicase